MDDLAGVLPAVAGQPAPVGAPPISIGGEPQAADPIAPAIDPATGQPVPEAPAAPMFQLPSGTVYNSVEDMVRGATEKDFTIERLKAENAQLKTVQSQPQQQAMPQAGDALAALERECEIELRNDPNFAGATDAEYKTQARLEARALQRAENRIMSKIEGQTKLAQFDAFVKSNPDLQGELATFVYDRAKANGQEFKNPYAHLDAVHAEMYRRGMTPTQSQAGGTQAVAGALAQNQQAGRIFQNVQGGAAPQTQPVSEYVTQAVELAKSRGITDPAQLEQVRSIAMNVDFSKFKMGGI